MPQLVQTSSVTLPSSAPSSAISPIIDPRRDFFPMNTSLSPAEEALDLIPHVAPSVLASSSSVSSSIAAGCANLEGSVYGPREMSVTGDGGELEK